MMHGLQALSGLTLALTGLGVGISVLGFAQVKSKLDRIDQKIDGLAERIEARFDEAKERDLRSREAELSGCLDNAEEGWHARDGGRRAWQGVADDLGKVEHAYMSDISDAIERGTTPTTLAYLVDRYRVCVATKLECLVLLDEYDQAKLYSDHAERRTSQLFDPITPVRLDNSFRRTGQPGPDRLERLRSRG